MQTLEHYIEDRYNNNMVDFLTSEVRNQQARVNKVVDNREYLKGIHQVLQRKDTVWKGKEFKSTKLVLQSAKTILNFHDTYLLGKNVSLYGSDDMVNEYNRVYRKGKYNKLDLDLKMNISRYGDVFEYVYYDGVIKSKLISADCGYPIFSEDTGDYIGFIEHYRINSSKVGYYNLYSEDKVEKWTNKGGYLHKEDECCNATGLPIHYHNHSDWNEKFGTSDLNDIRPIIDTLEDLYSKLNDAVYTLSINPMAVSVGQSLKDENISKDLVGTVLSLDSGDFKFANANMDYSTIKLLIDQLKEQLSLVSSLPSVCMGNTNISNVSEVSLGILYNLAEGKAMLDEKYIKDGFEERWDKIRGLLEKTGIRFNEDCYIDCEFNYSKVVNKKELLEELKMQFEMNAISLETIIEKSGLTNDVAREMERIENEKSKVDSNSVNEGNMDKDKDSEESEENKE